MERKLQLVTHGNRDSLEKLSDDELMLLAAGGRKAPFEQLVQRHHPVVLGYATRFLGDQVRGREVVQEVFLTVWQDRERYKPQGKFRSYLLAVAFNRCQEVARRRRSSTRKKEDLAERSEEPAEQTGPLDRLLDAEKAVHLRKKLLQLNERTRRAVILRVVNGLSYDEISAATGQPPGTLKSQVCRGLRELYTLLDQEHRT